MFLVVLTNDMFAHHYLITYLFLGPFHGHCVIHNLGSFFLCHPNGHYLIDISFIGSFENMVWYGMVIIIIFYKCDWGMKFVHIIIN
jgi:hypothetical protein